MGWFPRVSPREEKQTSKGLLDSLVCLVQACVGGQVLAALGGVVGIVVNLAMERRVMMTSVLMGWHS